MTATNWLFAPGTYDWGQKPRSRERSAAQPVALFFVLYVGAGFNLPPVNAPRGA